MKDIEDLCKYCASRTVTLKCVAETYGLDHTVILTYRGRCGFCKKINGVEEVIKIG